MSASVSAAPSDAITATGAMSFVDTSVPDLVDRALDTGDDFEESAEPMERYLFSGLHYPICIGQVLDQAYRIEHKLAFPCFYSTRGFFILKQITILISV